MDSFFGIGLPELILILLISGLVMGPQRIRQVALYLGRITAQLQAISRQFARQLNAELDSLDSEEVKGTMQDMRELQKELAELRREIGKGANSVSPKNLAPSSLIRESKEAVEEGEAVLSGKPSGEEKKETPTPNTQPSSAGPSPENEVPTALPKALDIPDDPE